MDDLTKYTAMVAYAVEVPWVREFQECGQVLEKTRFDWERVGETRMGFDPTVRRMTFPSVFVAAEAEMVTMVRRASSELIKETCAPDGPNSGATRTRSEFTSIDGQHPGACDGWTTQ